MIDILYNFVSQLTTGTELRMDASLNVIHVQLLFPEGLGVHSRMTVLQISCIEEGL